MVLTKHRVSILSSRESVQYSKRREGVNSIIVCNCSSGDNKGITSRRLGLEGTVRERVGQLKWREWENGEDE